MGKKRRFVSTTDEEIEQKRHKMNAHKTIKQNIAAATLTMQTENYRRSVGGV
jgi:hypothetical protein